ncbi:MAG: hypothetical protein WCJ19_00340 [bacterium]
MPNDFENLINYIQRLPGIGPKAATRIAIYLLTKDNKLANELSTAISHTVNTVGTCINCGNFSKKGSLCAICNDSKRNRASIAIVAGISDIYAIEKAGVHDGMYFVFDAIDNLFEDKYLFDNQIEKLASIIKGYMDKVESKVEVIFALPYNIDSEVACSVISEKLADLFSNNIHLSRISLGMPSGADFDYTDKLTILKSFKGRTVV